MDDPNYEDDIYSYPTLMRVKKRVQFPPLPAGYLRLPKPVMRYFSPMLRGWVSFSDWHNDCQQWLIKLSNLCWVFLSYSKETAVPTTCQGTVVMFYLHSYRQKIKMEICDLYPEHFLYRDIKLNWGVTSHIYWSPHGLKCRDHLAHKNCNLKCCDQECSTYCCMSHVSCSYEILHVRHKMHDC